MKRLIFCGVLILALSGCAEPVMGWGLSFPYEGQPPAHHRRGTAAEQQDQNSTEYQTFHIHPTYTKTPPVSS